MIIWLLHGIVNGFYEQAKSTNTFYVKLLNHSLEFEALNMRVPVFCCDNLPSIKSSSPKSFNLCKNESLNFPDKIKINIWVIVIAKILLMVDWSSSMHQLWNRLLFRRGKFEAKKYLETVRWTLKLQRQGRWAETDEKSRTPLKFYFKS